MARVKLVTGYVPIEVRHRTKDEYYKLGEKLTALPIKKAVYIDALQDCWLHRFLSTHPEITPLDGGDPGKNTLDYHCVQHQKTEWLYDAACAAPDADVLVWMDYGIFHMPGFTMDGVIDFLADCSFEKGISIPGCWPRGQDGGPCWRFCGSIIVCHRAFTHLLAAVVRNEAVEHINRTNTVTWEVNTWAAVEARDLLPIRWYAADHNSSMLTNYKVPHDQLV